MITKLALGITAALMIRAGECEAQQFTRIDSIRSDANFSVYEYNLQVPVGQTFITKAPCSPFSYVKAFMPDNSVSPLLRKDTLGNRIRTHLSWESTSSSVYYSEVSKTEKGTSYHYKVTTGTNKLDQNPDNYLMEFMPDPAMPMSLNLNLGYGGARLDLSDLSVEALEIFSGATDVFLTYQSPNRVPMSSLKIKSGMSKVVLRNLEMARAENIHVENGMGNTKIVIGNQSPHKSTIQVEVGAGSCTLLVNEDVPMKIVMNGNFLSTVQIPKDFIKVAENVFENIHYKRKASEATTIFVDLGIGNFSLITYKQ